MGYGMIENVGNRMVELLRRELVPSVVQHSSQIGLCSPKEHGDLRLGVFLYDVRENEDIRASGMINEGVDRQSYPPVYLSLYYMLTAYSDSDLLYRAQEEHRILGKVVQALRDYSVLEQEALGDGAGMPAQIQLQRMEPLEKIRVWNFGDEPYRLSLFYRIQPVEISSGREREITRVKEVDYNVSGDTEASGRGHFHASLVVLAIDDLTGKPVAEGTVSVSVPGHRPPVVKSDGYYVFVNLTESKVTLVFESRVYMCRTERISLQGRDEDTVFLIRLRPDAAYPFAGNVALISGKTRPGRRLLFWNGKSAGYRLFENYPCEGREDGRLLALYHGDDRELEGQRFFIFDRENTVREYFRVTGREGRLCRIDRTLLREYKKNGARVLPVWEVTAGETGDFFLPVEGERRRHIELYCLAEGEEEEKRFSLRAGKSHIISV